MSNPVRNKTVSLKQVKSEPVYIMSYLFDTPVYVVYVNVCVGVGLCVCVWMDGCVDVIGRL